MCPPTAKTDIVRGFFTSFGLEKIADGDGGAMADHPLRARPPAGGKAVNADNAAARIEDLEVDVVVIFPRIAPPARRFLRQWRA
jgi:hypothetical protein